MHMHIDKCWFEDWFNSPYYHLLYSNRDEQEAAAFIDKLLAYLQPATGAEMLDVACGRDAMPNTWQIKDTT